MRSLPWQRSLRWLKSYSVTVNKIHCEMLKVLNAVELWLTNLFDVALRTRNSVTFVLVVEQWILPELLRGSWKFGSPVCICFVDLEKSYICAPGGML